MPIINEWEHNSVLYDINDKRIDGTDITNWNNKLSSIPIASAQVVGGIMVGSGLSIDANGVLSATGGGGYVLPAATTTTLGGVIVGNNLTIDNSGVLSLDAGVGVSVVSTTLEISSEAPATLGYIAGTGISINYNEISIDSTTLQTISDKQDRPTEVTTGTTITLADNTEYRLTDVTTLTLSYPSGNFECWLRLSFASSGTINVTLPTSSYIGAAPSFANGDVWELSIKDGVVVAGKVIA